VEGDGEVEKDSGEIIVMQLHQSFILIAKKYPGKLSFIDRTSDRRITYSKALIASLILSEKFKKYDKGFIGIMIPTSAGCGLSILGALMSGRTPVMINYSTGAAMNAEHARNKCGFKTIITSRALLEKINCPFLDGMVFIEDIMQKVTIINKIRAALTAKMPLPLILKTVHSGNESETATILFTSGSEKDPKAVELTHKNISSNVDASRHAYNLSHEDILLASLPYFHVFGLTVELWLPLTTGMTIVTFANPLDYKTICTVIREEKPTIMASTPSFYWGYLRKSEPGDFQSIKYAISGADKCPESLREEFRKKHNLTLYEGYGATETSPSISANTPDFNRPGSIGKPLPGVEVRIENYETGESCAPGEVGRIMIKGDLVMKGYFDDLEETSMRIRGGWYDTGDMGYIDHDGYLWHSGRLKRFVKIGGEMVSLVKVEDAVEKLIPQDILCCVVEIPDQVKGARIIVAVTDTVDERKILKQLGEVLPAIAIPKQFIVIKELPRMGSGKIDFRAATEIVRSLMNKKDS
jgi:acyl-[acyl-carrier-protein]-phospholipid O-acyltransferase/long-chain-fatty-acid--[acyl-carrier-protein] ligase